jgi:hypothetical protein
VHRQSGGVRDGGERCPGRGGGFGGDPVDRHDGEAEPVDLGALPGGPLTGVEPHQHELLRA